jgi:peptide/nickel transport system permease protein
LFSDLSFRINNILVALPESVLNQSGSNIRALVLKLIVMRLLQGVVVLLVVSALTFWLLAAAGGDALVGLSLQPMVSQAAIAELRHVYGLDQPLAVRYLHWLADLAHGRMGYSFYFHTPVQTIIWPRLLHTLLLAALALMIAWGIALTLGALAARRRGGAVDRLCGVLILLTASLPRIVLALAALALAARTGLFTIGAATTTPPGLAAEFNPMRVFVPALVLALPLVALFLAQTREGLSAALAEEFVQVARAKGLQERTVVLRHALRAALNPLITIFGYSLGSVVSGSVIVETVLGWPGLGQLSVTAVLSRDVPLLMGVVLLTATAVLIGNLLADILLRFNDPRLRAAQTGTTTLNSAA